MVDCRSEHARDSVWGHAGNRGKLAPTRGYGKCYKDDLDRTIPLPELPTDNM
jgi:hypothetical protein